jgi:phospholipid transport system substrate-binding protein
MTANRRRFLTSATALAGAMLVAGGAAQAQDAGAFVDSVARQVLDRLKQGTSDAERTSLLRTVLRTHFDLPAMGRAALGQNWNKATPEQQQRFLAAVEHAEVRAYSDRLKQYGGQTLKVLKVTPGPGGARLVDSIIQQPGGADVVRLVWEVHSRGGRQLVTDVSIEGVSMVLTRRSDFAAYISRNGGTVEPLIAELERRAK